MSSTSGKNMCPTTSAGFGTASQNSSIWPQYDKDARGYEMFVRVRYLYFSVSCMKCYRLDIIISADEVTKWDEHTIVLSYNSGTASQKPSGDV
jgi:hypothetical protein